MRLISKQEGDFKMEEKLTKLYNTLNLIETKGESTKYMGDCLKYIEQIIKEIREADTEG